MFDFKPIRNNDRHRTAAGICNDNVFLCLIVASALYIFTTQRYFNVSSSSSSFWSVAPILVIICQHCYKADHSVLHTHRWRPPQPVNQRNWLIQNASSIFYPSHIYHDNISSQTQTRSQTLAADLPHLICTSHQLFNYRASVFYLANVCFVLSLFFLFLCFAFASVFKLHKFPLSRSPFL